MIFNTDIKRALIDHRDRTTVDLLEQVSSLLLGEERTYGDISERLSVSGEVDHRIESTIDEEVFSIEEIRAIAIRYDLRFLDSSLFKGNVPMTALQTIKCRESERGERFRAFKILAPGELFQLEDENADPLLFGQMRDGRYELLAQWGGDISVLRKVMNYPKRNFLTLAATLILFTLLVVTVLPEQIFQSDAVIGHLPMVRPLFFFFFLTFISGVTAYVWFAFQKQFSSHTWNSRSF